MRKALLPVFAVAAAACSTWVSCRSERPCEKRTEPKAEEKRERRRRPPGRHILSLLDADKDGVISSSEIDNAPNVLRKLDGNKDGQLSADEVMPHRHRHRGHGRGPGPGMWESRKPVSSRSLSAHEKEKRIMDVIDEVEQKGIGMSNIPGKDGRLLRLLVELIDAKRVVEIGTSNGFSGLWICLALQSTNGKLTTFEISSHRAALARKHFEKAGVSARVEIVEGDAHKKIARLQEPIDLLFLDADKQGYIDYLTRLLPLVRPGGLVVAHNARRPPLDPRYFSAITTNPALMTMFFHMDEAGIAVTLKKRKPSP